MNVEAIEQDIAHRPWSLPQGPWIMTQAWHELLFAHWEVKPEVMRELIPPELTLDTYEGCCWLGVVPFRMSHVSPRGVPEIAGVSRFLELNVRTYVSCRGVPGVFFFSLDASNALAVAVARSIFHLPYFNASMQSWLDGDTIYYRSQRTHRGASAAELISRYRPVGPQFQARRGTLDYFLTERYCLYTVVGKGRVYRADIHHRPWDLQPAEQEIERNSMASAHGIVLPSHPPLLRYAHRQDVLVWPLQRCEVSDTL